MPAELLETPAKITPLHIAQPIDANKAGTAAGKRYRHIGEHPLEAAYHRGQLAHGIIKDVLSDGKTRVDRYTAADRRGAGTDFLKIWQDVCASGRDSTQTGFISGNPTEPMTQKQAEAIQMHGKLCAALREPDRLIIQWVCGEGYWPSTAVRTACGDGYEDATIPRLNEALDHLVEAFRKLGK